MSSGVRNRSLSPRAARGHDFRRRYRLTCAALVAMGGLLLARAADVQIIHHRFYLRQAEARMLRHHPLRAHRGTLYDRHGTVIAGSAPVASLWIDPSEFFDASGSVEALATALDADAAALVRLLARDRKRRFVYLPGFRRGDPTTLEALLAKAPTGVHLQREFKRFYPQSDLFAQVIGITDIEGHGVEGLERMFETRLAGRAGYRDVIIDRKGRPVELRDRGRPARAGEDIVLSLDSRMQYTLHAGLGPAAQRHGAAAASVVVLEVGSGQVLAMVNWPTYNNNNPGAGPINARRNRAVTDVFEPGSTVKPFTVAAALDAGVITTTSSFNTHPGWIRNGRFTTRDYRDLGVLDTTEVLKKSSNVGISLISRRLSNDQLHDMFAALGAGHPTGSGFPGERSGTLADTHAWSGTSKQTMAYGYGLSMTTLQLANAYATLANHGMRVQPTFELGQSPARTRAIPAHVAEQVLSMLATTSGPGGTATRARIIGYPIAGKTGTARKASAGGYARRYTSLFAGLVPADHPRYAVAVVVDDPDARLGGYGGGAVAAPIFSELIGRVLHLTDIAPETRD
ncbi:peptidoglycan D,D-transpeptidase FtsI family protein [Stenotrophomonas maltophilia]|uniref:peptidoglycan D,D-transpeptidase FtsI family protein n=1 Tax=Stenotrophomonas TaxID=40323 RepID=UPI003077A25F